MNRKPAPRVNVKVRDQFGNEIEQTYADLDSRDDTSISDGTFITQMGIKTKDLMNPTWDEICNATQQPIQISGRELGENWSERCE